MKLQDILMFNLAKGISLEEYQEILNKISRLERRASINLDNMQHWQDVLNNMSGSPEQVARWQKKLSQAQKAYKMNVNELTLLNKKIGRL
jgi:uncharacterized transporter YbjL